MVTQPSQLKEEAVMFKIVSDDFNIATYASVLLGLGDITWLVNDICRNGFDIGYAIVATLFLFGNLGLAWGLHKHHARLVRHSLRFKRRTEDTV